MRESAQQHPFAGIIDPAFIARRWRLIAGSTVIAGLLAAIYVAVASPAYRAEVRVVVQNLGLGAESNGKPTYDKEFLSTQAEVIRSPAILQRALQMVPPHPSDKPLESAGLIEDLAERLQVNLLAGTDIVRTTFEHRDPQHAAQRLKSVIDSYKEHARSVEQSSTSQSVDLLTQREQELHDQLQTLQQRSVNLRSDALGVPAGSTVEDSPLLKELTNRWIVVESQLAAAESKVAGGTVYAANLVDSPAARELADLENQAVVARLDAAKAERIYGPAHPELTSTKERAVNLTREVGDRRQQALTGLLSIRDALIRERGQLQSLIGRETERLQSANDARLEHEQVQAEITRLSEIHSSTAKALEAVRLTDRTLAVGRTSILIDVLDEFAVPREAVWPKPVPLIAVAVVLGLLLGAAVALVLETRGRSGLGKSPLVRETNGFIPADERFHAASIHYSPEALAR